MMNTDRQNIVGNGSSETSHVIESSTSIPSIDVGGLHERLIQSVQPACSPSALYDDYRNDPRVKEKWERYRAWRNQVTERRAELEKTEKSNYKVAETAFNSWYTESEKALCNECGIEDVSDIQSLDRQIANETFGFTKADVLEALDRYNKFCERAYGERHTAEFCHETSKYVPLMSVILKMYGADLRGRRIVEVGPGYEGMRVLHFFRSLGADVIGIDSNSDREGDVIRTSHWNTLSQVIEPTSADVIFIHHMTPNAHNEDMDEEGFNNACVREMDMCLKPGGVLLGHTVVSDKPMPHPAFYGVEGYDQVTIQNMIGQIPLGSITLDIKKL